MGSPVWGGLQLSRSTWEIPASSSHFLFICQDLLLLFTVSSCATKIIILPHFAHGILCGPVWPKLTTLANVVAGSQMAAVVFCKLLPCHPIFLLRESPHLPSASSLVLLTCCHCSWAQRCLKAALAALMDKDVHATVCRIILELATKPQFILAYKNSGLGSYNEQLSAPKSRGSLRLRRRVLPLPEKSRLFEAPRCAIFSAKKIASEPRFSLRWERVKVILAAKFPAKPSSAVKITSERQCAILVRSDEQYRYSVMK